MCLAIPGKVLKISENNGLRAGRVEFGGIVSQVCLDFVPEVQIGDYVIVHVGFAISKVDREEAERTYQALQSMGLLEGELPQLPVEPVEDIT
jgi:hydrogenase expression/formation protein HypC